MLKVFVAVPAVNEIAKQQFHVLFLDFIRLNKLWFSRDALESPVNEGAIELVNLLNTIGIERLRGRLIG